MTADTNDALKLQRQRIRVMALAQAQRLKLAETTNKETVVAPSNETTAPAQASIETTTPTKASAPKPTSEPTPIPASEPTPIPAPTPIKSSDEFPTPKMPATNTAASSETPIKIKNANYDYFDKNLKFDSEIDKVPAPTSEQLMQSVEPSSEEPTGPTQTLMPEEIPKDDGKGDMFSDWVGSDRYLPNTDDVLDLSKPISVGEAPTPPQDQSMEIPLGIRGLWKNSNRWHDFTKATSGFPDKLENYNAYNSAVDREAIRMQDDGQSVDQINQFIISSGDRLNKQFPNTIKKLANRNEYNASWEKWHDADAGERWVPKSRAGIKNAKKEYEKLKFERDTKYDELIKTDKVAAENLHERYSDEMEVYLAQTQGFGWKAVANSMQDLTEFSFKSTLGAVNEFYNLFKQNYIEAKPTHPRENSRIYANGGKQIRAKMEADYQAKMEAWDPDLPAYSSFSYPGIMMKQSVVETGYGAEVVNGIELSYEENWKHVQAAIKADPVKVLSSIAQESMTDFYLIAGLLASGATGGGFSPFAAATMARVYKIVSLAKNAKYSVAAMQSIARSARIQKILAASATAGDKAKSVGSSIIDVTKVTGKAVATPFTATAKAAELAITKLGWSSQVVSLGTGLKSLSKGIGKVVVYDGLGGAAQGVIANEAMNIKKDVLNTAIVEATEEIIVGGGIKAFSVTAKQLNKMSKKLRARYANKEKLMDIIEENHARHEEDPDFYKNNPHEAERMVKTITLLGEHLQVMAAKELKGIVSNPEVIRSEGNVSRVNNDLIEYTEADNDKTGRFYELDRQTGKEIFKIKKELGLIEPSEKKRWEKRVKTSGEIFLTEADLNNPAISELIPEEVASNLQGYLTERFDIGIQGSATGEQFEINYNEEQLNKTWNKLNSPEDISVAARDYMKRTSSNEDVLASFNNPADMKSLGIDEVNISQLKTDIINMSRHEKTGKKRPIMEGKRFANWMKDYAYAKILLSNSEVLIENSNAGWYASKASANVPVSFADKKAFQMASMENNVGVPTSKHSNHISQHPNLLREEFQITLMKNRIEAAEGMQMNMAPEEAQIFSGTVAELKKLNKEQVTIHEQLDAAYDRYINSSPKLREAISSDIEILHAQFMQLESKHFTKLAAIAQEIGELNKSDSFFLDNVTDEEMEVLATTPDAMENDPVLAGMKLNEAVENAPDNTLQVQSEDGSTTVTLSQETDGSVIVETKGDDGTDSVSDVSETGKTTKVKERVDKTKMTAKGEISSEFESIVDQENPELGTAPNVPEIVRAVQAKPLSSEEVKSMFNLPKVHRPINDKIDLVTNAVREAHLKKDYPTVIAQTNELKSLLTQVFMENGQTLENTKARFMEARDQASEEYLNSPDKAAVLEQYKGLIWLTPNGNIEKVSIKNLNSKTDTKESRTFKAFRSKEIANGTLNVLATKDGMDLLPVYLGLDGAFKNPEKTAMNAAKAETMIHFPGLNNMYDNNVAWLGFAPLKKGRDPHIKIRMSKEINENSGNGYEQFLIPMKDFTHWMMNPNSTPNNVRVDLSGTTRSPVIETSNLKGKEVEMRKAGVPNEFDRYNMEQLLSGKIGKTVEQSKKLAKESLAIGDVVYLRDHNRNLRKFTNSIIHPGGQTNTALINTDIPKFPITIVTSHLDKLSVPLVKENSKYLSYDTHHKNEVQKTMDENNPEAIKDKAVRKQLLEEEAAETKRLEEEYNSAMKALDQEAAEASQETAPAQEQGTTAPPEAAAPVPKQRRKLAETKEEVVDPIESLFGDMLNNAKQQSETASSPKKQPAAPQTKGKPSAKKTRTPEEIEADRVALQEKKAIDLKAIYDSQQAELKYETKKEGERLNHTNRTKNVKVVKTKNNVPMQQRQPASLYLNQVKINSKESTPIDLALIKEALITPNPSTAQLEALSNYRDGNDLSYTGIKILAQVFKSVTKGKGTVIDLNSGSGANWRALDGIAGDNFYQISEGHGLKNMINSKLHSVQTNIYPNNLSKIAPSGFNSSIFVAGPHELSLRSKGERFEGFGRSNQGSPSIEVDASKISISRKDNFKFAKAFDAVEEGGFVFAVFPVDAVFNSDGTPKGMVSALQRRGDVVLAHNIKDVYEGGGNGVVFGLKKNSEGKVDPDFKITKKPASMTKTLKDIKQAKTGIGGALRSIGNNIEFGKNPPKVEFEFNTNINDIDTRAKGKDFVPIEAGDAGKVVSIEAQRMATIATKIMQTQASKGNHSPKIEIVLDANTKTHVRQTTHPWPSGFGLDITGKWDLDVQAISAKTRQKVTQKQLEEAALFVNKAGLPLPGPQHIDLGNGEFHASWMPIVHFDEKGAVSGVAIGERIMGEDLHNITADFLRTKFPNKSIAIFTITDNPELKAAYISAMQSGAVDIVITNGKSQLDLDHYYGGTKITNKVYDKNYKNAIWVKGEIKSGGIDRNAKIQAKIKDLTTNINTQEDLLNSLSEDFENNFPAQLSQMIQTTHSPGFKRMMSKEESFYGDKGQTPDAIMQGKYFFEDYNGSEPMTFLSNYGPSKLRIMSKKYLLEADNMQKDLDYSDPNRPNNGDKVAKAMEEIEAHESFGMFLEKFATMQESSTEAGQGMATHLEEISKETQAYYNEVASYALGKVFDSQTRLDQTSIENRKSYENVPKQKTRLPAEIKASLDRLGIDHDKAFTFIKAGLAGKAASNAHIIKVITHMHNEMVINVQNQMLGNGFKSGSSMKPSALAESLDLGIETNGINSSERLKRLKEKTTSYGNLNVNTNNKVDSYLNYTEDSQQARQDKNTAQLNEELYTDSNNEYDGYTEPNISDDKKIPSDARDFVAEYHNNEVQIAAYSDIILNPKINEKTKDIAKRKLKKLINYSYGLEERIKSSTADVNSELYITKLDKLLDKYTDENYINEVDKKIRDGENQKAILNTILSEYDKVYDQTGSERNKAKVISAAIAAQKGLDKQKGYSYLAVPAFLLGGFTFATLLNGAMNAENSGEEGENDNYWNMALWGGGFAGLAMLGRKGSRNFIKKRAAGIESRRSLEDQDVPIGVTGNVSFDKINDELLTSHYGAFGRFFNSTDATWNNAIESTKDKGLINFNLTRQLKQLALEKAVASAHTTNQIDLLASSFTPKELNAVNNLYPDAYTAFQNGMIDEFYIEENVTEEQKAVLNLQLKAHVSINEMSLMAGIKRPVYLNNTNINVDKFHTTMLYDLDRLVDIAAKSLYNKPRADLTVSEKKRVAREIYETAVRSDKYSVQAGMKVTTEKLGNWVAGNSNSKERTEFIKEMNDRVNFLYEDSRSASTRIHKKPVDWGDGFVESSYDHWSSNARSAVNSILNQKKFGEDLFILKQHLTEVEDAMGGESFFNGIFGYNSEDLVNLLAKEIGTTRNDLMGDTQVRDPDMLAKHKLKKVSEYLNTYQHATKIAASFKAGPINATLALANNATNLGNGPILGTAYTIAGMAEALFNTTDFERTLIRQTTDDRVMDENSLNSTSKQALYRFLESGLKENFFGTFTAESAEGKAIAAFKTGSGIAGIPWKTYKTMNSFVYMTAYKSGIRYGNDIASNWATNPDAHVSKFKELQGVFDDAELAEIKQNKGKLTESQKERFGIMIANRVNGTSARKWDLPGWMHTPAGQNVMMFRKTLNRLWRNNAEMYIDNLLDPNVGKGEKVKIGFQFVSSMLASAGVSTTLIPGLLGILGQYEYQEDSLLEMDPISRILSLIVSNGTMVTGAAMMNEALNVDHFNKDTFLLQTMGGAHISTLMNATKSALGDDTFLDFVRKELVFNNQSTNMQRYGQFFNVRDILTKGEFNQSGVSLRETKDPLQLITGLTKIDADKEYYGIIDPKDNYFGLKKGLAGLEGNDADDISADQAQNGRDNEGDFNLRDLRIPLLDKRMYKSSAHNSIYKKAINKEVAKSLREGLGFSQTEVDQIMKLNDSKTNALDLMASIRDHFQNKSVLKIKEDLKELRDRLYVMQKESYVRNDESVDDVINDYEKVMIPSVE